MKKLQFWKDRKSSQQGPSGAASSATENALDSSTEESLFPDGTLGLHVLHDPDDPSVDVVFVHGLTGNAYKTWAEQGSSKYWPKDFLPNDLPDARIIAFGYDADVTRPFFGAVSQNNLRDHSLALLGDLSRLRNTTGSADRPIAFVAHSLGGLVTMKALCISDSNNFPHLGQVALCIAAVLFLGTPHRGSSLAQWTSIYARMVKASGQRVNTNILETCKRYSEVLDDVENSFAGLLQRKSLQHSVVCFYEELELPSLGSVVMKESATINGCLSLGIHANHITMTKFRSRQDQGYIRIVGELTRVLNEEINTIVPSHAEIERDLGDDVKDCLKSFAFPEMNDRHHDIDPESLDTCAWLPQHRHWRNWIDNQGLLWIKGNPGSGKSTLLKYALHNLQKFEGAAFGTHPVLLSFFFHGRGIDLQKTPLGLFRSLLHQLISQMPQEFCDTVQMFKRRCDTMGAPGIKWNWTEGELKSIFRRWLFEAVRKAQVWIFIDALDECGKGTACSLASLFDDYIQHMSRSGADLHICFTCRHYPNLALETPLEICVEDENGDDIATFVDQKLRHGISDETKCTIINRSEGVFQWVRLIVDDVLESCRRGDSAMRIQRKIELVPQDLHSLYRTLLEGMTEEKESSLKLIQWISCALQPLTISEMRHAILLDPERRPKSLQELQSMEDYAETDESMISRVKTLSCGLAEVRESEEGAQIVQFIHQSVQDFILQDGLRLLMGDCNPAAYVVGLVHHQLARSCLRYLHIDEIEELVLCWDDADSQVDNLEELFYSIPTRKARWALPLLSYAGELWAEHCALAEAKKISQADLIVDFGWPSNNIPKLHYYVFDVPYELMDKYALIHFAAACGLESLVRALRDQTGVNLGLKNSRGQTPLSLASCNGHFDVVRFLLDQEGGDIKAGDYRNRMPLSYAAQEGHEAIVALLLAQSDVEAHQKDDEGLTPLFYAAECGNEAIFRLLLDQDDIEADSADSEGRTPLSYAAEYGHEAICRLLLDRDDVEADLEDFAGGTPLCYAAKGGSEAVVRLLLARDDINPDWMDHEGRTPLRYAAEYGNEAAARLLLAREDVNAETYDGEGHTPLCIAIVNESEKVARLLLTREDVKADVQDHEGRTPLSLAAAYGVEAIVRLLLTRKDVKADSQDDQGRTPISWAASGCGDEAVVKSEVRATIVDIFLERDDVNANSKDDRGRTPLHWAALTGRWGPVERLIGRQDVDVFSKDFSGKTPLQLAEEEFATRVFRYYKLTEGYEVTFRLLKQHMQIHTTRS